MGNSSKVTGSSGLMRSINMKIVLNIILQHEPISRTEISERAGLAMPTVMRMIDVFLADGLVRELGKGDSSGGRKPVMLCVNPDAYCFLGTDISRECHSVVTDIHGQIKGKSQRVLDYAQDADGVAAQVRENMRRAVAESGIAAEQIVYSGVGTPGIGFKYIGEPSHIFSFWSTADSDQLQQKLDIGYPTAFENVGRLGAAAELRYGVGKELSNFLYIYADEGIGMGAVLDGRLESGHLGIGGEFGHSTINYGGQLCYCGNRGCVEAYCSSPALLREYRTLLVSSGTAYREEDLTLFHLMCEVESGNKTAMQVVREAGKALGVGIANLINIYNPEAIVMGGELSQTLPLYAESAESEARLHIFLQRAADLHFFEASVDRHAEAVGAAAVAVEAFLSRYCER